MKLTTKRTCEITITLDECGAPASHTDPQTGSHFCYTHVEDYAEAFGWESLRSIEAESPNAKRFVP